MNISQKTNLELLAPAGSVEAFFAAVENGADAVFCGLSQFSARAKAKNFTLQELELLKGYAEKKGVKVYVALNTLLQETELPQMIELLAKIEYLQVDAVIIQDLGLYNLAHTYFPGIVLHASTQLVTHNLAGVLMLESMGFSRVVLARELTLQEITHIHSKSSIEIEHFIHGAMCYSISGHCLFSSYIDGRSGNRGRCIQPCRRRYHYDGEAGFYFSTSDFSAIELLPELIQAGVSSFKIEGRMKSAEYVASVVASYRMVLDAKPSEMKNVAKIAQKTLSKAMGRSASHGFLKGTANKKLVLAHQKGGLGKTIGTVQRVQKDMVSFTTGDVVHVGDRLRVQPDNDRAGSGFTIRALTINNKLVKRAGRGSFVTVQLPKSIRVTSGDLVFKLSTGKLFTTSKEACMRRLATAPVRSHNVSLIIECGDGWLSVAASIEGLQIEKKYSVEMFAAERSPLTVQTLQKVFSKTTNPVLSLASLTASNLPPVVIKPSRLKEIRRDFYQFLFETFKENQTVESSKKIGEIQSVVKKRNTAGKSIATGEQLFLVSDMLGDIAVIEEYPELIFILPLQADILLAVLEQEIMPHRVIWDLPSMTFDADYSSLQQNIAKVVAAGFLQFRLNSLSHCRLFANGSGLKLYGGIWLYCLNSQAIRFLANQQIEKCTLSIEDDRLNIEQLFEKIEKHNLLITVYGAVDLFTSRIQARISDQDFMVKNDKGGLLQVKQKHGLVVTQAEKPFSLLGRIDPLRRLGCVNFVLDLRGLGVDSEVGREVLQAFYEDCTLPSTTPFNFERGLS